MDLDEGRAKLRPEGFEAVCWGSAMETRLARVSAFAQSQAYKQRMIEGAPGRELVLS